MQPPQPPVIPGNPSNPAPPVNPGDDYVIELMFENTIIPLPLVYGSREVFRGTMEISEYRERTTRQSRQRNYETSQGVYYGVVTAQRQNTPRGQVVSISLNVQYQQANGWCQFNETFVARELPSDNRYVQGGCELDIFVGPDFDNALLPLEPVTTPTPPPRSPRDEIDLRRPIF